MWQRFCYLLHWLTCPDTGLVRNVEKMLPQACPCPFCVHKFQSHLLDICPLSKILQKADKPALSYESARNLPSLGVVITSLCTRVETAPCQAYRKGAGLDVRLCCASKKELKKLPLYCGCATLCPGGGNAGCIRGCC